MIRISIEAKSTHTVVAIDGYVDQADLRQIERVRKELSGEVHLNLLGLEGSAPGCGLVVTALTQSWRRPLPRVPATALP